MTREIKFKFWDRIMRRFSIPCLLMDLAYQGFPRPITDENGDVTFNEDIDVVQYTGLKDKNGKEIYEGDILAYSNERSPKNGILKGTVIFEKGGFKLKYGVTSPHIDAKSAPFGLYPYTRAHVIVGNIYENPDLIK